MTIDTNTRRTVMRRVAEEMARTGTVGLTKTELIAAVGGIDDYLEANANAINVAIPQPARSALTTPQKAALMAYVALARYGG